MQYDEAGAPKEDRIAENRLRRRRRDDRPSETTNTRGRTNKKSGSYGNGNGNGNNNRDSDDEEFHDDRFHDGSHDGSHNNENSDRGGGGGGQEALERGDTVMASVGGREQERMEATVEEYLGDDTYRVSFADGSGTKDLRSHKLR